MNRKLFALIVVSGLLAGLGVMPLFAQLTPQIKADIPFEFVVGNQTMPAGQYIVDSRSTPVVVAIQNEATQDTAFVLTNSVESLKYSDQTKLVFHRYGNQYFLAQIWKQGAYDGREVPKSKAEREAGQRAWVQRENVTVLAMR